MAGAEENGEIVGEDEMSEDGSVDLENESDDDLDDDVEGEGEGQGDVAEAGDDAMEIDDAPVDDGSKGNGIASH